MTLKLTSKEWVASVLLVVLLADLAILLNIPFLRQVLVSLLCIFIPGLLILQILKWDTSGKLEMILFSIGLSVAFLMSIGALADFLLDPAFGISKPLSALPLTITISTIITILSAIGYLRNKNSVIFGRFNPKELFNPVVLSLVLLIILNILGIARAYYHGENYLLYLVDIFIPATVSFAVLGKIPSRYFPLVIFAISVSLVMQCSLTVFYIVGEHGDLATEFYFYNIVEKNGNWDSSIPDSMNAMLSIVILPTMLVNLLHVGAEWIFRIALPMGMAVAPLALFQAYKTQTNDKTALLACFFFVSIPAFLFTVPIQSRMSIAELFLGLLVLLITLKRVAQWKRSLLLIIFIFSIIVSHYGTSYILVFFLITLIPFYSMITRWERGNFGYSLRMLNVRLGMNNQQIGELRHNGKSISTTLILFAVLLTVAWYMYVSSSASFDHLIRIGNHIYDTFQSDILDKTARESATLTALGLGEQAESPWHAIGRLIWQITEFMVVVGAISLLATRKSQGFSYEFTAMIYIGLFLLGIAMIVPNLSTQFSMGRIYHLTLVFLAPCCIIGAQNIFGWIHKTLAKVSASLLKEASQFFQQLSVALILVVLVFNFLINSNFVYSITDPYPPYGALTMGKYSSGDDPNSKGTYLIHQVPKEDLVSAEWLAKYHTDTSKVLAEYTALKNLLTPYPLPPTLYRMPLFRDQDWGEYLQARRDDWIYLRGFNNRAHKVFTGRISYTNAPDQFFYYDLSELSQLNDMNRVYSNGSSEIYRFRYFTK